MVPNDPYVRSSIAFAFGQKVCSTRFWDVLDEGIPCVNNGSTCLQKA